jgi:hypothetical protein
MLGAAYCVWASHARKRHVGVLFAVIAPLALLAGVAGAVLALRPDFLH